MVTFKNEIYLGIIMVPDLSCSMLITDGRVPEGPDNSVCAAIVIGVLQAVVT